MRGGKLGEQGVAFLLGHARRRHRLFGLRLFAQGKGMLEPAQFGAAQGAHAERLATGRLPGAA